MDLVVARHKPLRLYRPQIRDQGCPTSEGQPRPLQGQRFRQAECKAERSSCFAEARKRRPLPRFSGVTRKVSSYSIHTLLCSDEHKNPSEDGLRENRSRPQHEAAWYALSLGCKGRGFRDGFSEAENAKGCHSDATSYHPRSER